MPIWHLFYSYTLDLSMQIKSRQSPKQASVLVEYDIYYFADFQLGNTNTRMTFWEA